MTGAGAARQVLTGCGGQNESAKLEGERRRWLGSGPQRSARGNVKNPGRTSTDRGNKATLPLTIPDSVQVVSMGFRSPRPAHRMSPGNRQPWRGRVTSVTAEQRRAREGRRRSQHGFRLRGVQSLADGW